MTDLSAEELLAFLDAKPSDLPTLEAAGLPTARKKRDGKLVTVYPWPSGLHWFIDYRVAQAVGGIPARVKQKDLATLIGRSTRQVSNLTAEGILPTIAENGVRTYPLPRAVLAFIEYCETQARGKKEETSELDKAKLRLTEAKAVREEMAKLREQGELLRRPLVEEALADLMQAVKSFMTNIPARWSPGLVQLQTQAAVRAQLKDVMNEGLTTLGDAAASVGRRIQVIGASDDEEEPEDDADDVG